MELLALRDLQSVASNACLHRPQERFLVEFQSEPWLKATQVDSIYLEQDDTLGK